MKDRFKYRVWNKDKNEMLLVYGFDKNFIQATPDLVVSSIRRLKTDDYILMQCTGLKDKNGKLIYEGDIVRYSEYDIEDIEPDWEYDEIVWGGKHSYPAFDLANNLFDCNGLSYIFNEGWTIEVIGNIYENAELIKECE